MCFGPCSLRVDNCQVALLGWIDTERYAASGRRRSELTAAADLSRRCAAMWLEQASSSECVRVHAIVIPQPPSKSPLTTCSLESHHKTCLSNTPEAVPVPEYQLHPDEPIVSASDPPQFLSVTKLSLPFYAMPAICLTPCSMSARQFQLLTGPYDT